MDHATIDVVSLLDVGSFQKRFLGRLDLAQSAATAQALTDALLAGFLVNPGATTAITSIIGGRSSRGLFLLPTAHRRATPNAVR